MSSIPQHPIPEAARSQAEGQLALWANINNSLLSGLTELTALNMQATRASLNESMELLHQMLAANNMQEVMALSAQQIQPNIDRLASYSRHLADIAAGIRTNVLESAQGKIGDAGQQNALLMEGMFKLPDGDANPFSGWMKSALDAANAGYEQMLGASAQMARNMDGQFGARETPAAQEEKANGRARKK